MLIIPLPPEGAFTELAVKSDSFPVTSMVLLNVALPASDISSVRAVIVEPPSLPLNKISPSEFVLDISLPSIVILSTVTPALAVTAPVKLPVVACKALLLG